MRSHYLQGGDNTSRGRRGQKTGPTPGQAKSWPRKRRRQAEKRNAERQRIANSSEGLNRKKEAFFRREAAAQGITVAALMANLKAAGQS